MKKSKVLFGLLFFVAILAATMLKVNLVFDAAEGDGLTLTNTEALAQGESGLGSCLGSGSVSCAGGAYRVKLD